MPSSRFLNQLRTSNFELRTSHRAGIALPLVLVMITVLLTVLPAILIWIQNEALWTVKTQKSTTAFNLAEAGIDRGVWMLKSSTSAWARAEKGTVITGYDFDVTYKDIPGGTYRISFSSGPAIRDVTITAEGRDAASRETRAIRAVYNNQAIPGAIISGGVISYNASFEVHWGPVLAHNNINISGNAATEYFPRKYSRQVVMGTMGQPRDTNGLDPPNTDNVEWWSDFDVPDLPRPNFEELRSSAEVTGTLNYYNGWTSSHTLTGYPAGGHGNCPLGSPHNDHFYDPGHHPLSKNNFVWYWDGNVRLTGTMTSGCHRLGLYGTVIVRGNLTIDSGDCYAFTTAVPANAWREYRRIKTAQWDSATDKEYPADLGLSSSAATFRLGNQTWTGGPPSANTDVGIRGFVYVGGNLTINSVSDINGALWVVGNITNNDSGERVLIFYDSNLILPTLNVVLTRQAWMEIMPSSVPPWI